MNQHTEEEQSAYEYIVLTTPELKNQSIEKIGFRYLNPTTQYGWEIYQKTRLMDATGAFHS